MISVQTIHAASQISISFVIPAYNCADTVRQAVESIVEGNTEAGDEIILVNDCSTDQTSDVLADLQAQYSCVKLLTHRINKGTAAAGRNTAIEQARNDLIFCLDADNLLVPNSVPHLKSHLLFTGADAAAFGELRFFVGTPENVTHKWVFRDTVTLADALAGNYWPGPSGNYLFTRTSWLRAGRYDEPTVLNQTLDSWTFGIRQLATGAKMVTLPDSYYLHRVGINSHYIRERTRGNVALAALSGLLPFLDSLNTRDVDRIMGRKERHSWFHTLEKRPLRLKDGTVGQTGMTTLPAPPPPSLRTRLRRRLVALWTKRGVYRKLLRRL